MLRIAQGGVVVDIGHYWPPITFPDQLSVASALVMRVLWVTTITYLVGVDMRDAGHKSMAMTKHYDHTREERYGGVIEALVVARTVTPQNSIACFHGYG